MTHRIALLGILSALVLGCSGSTAPAPSLPAPPSAPANAESIGSFAGAAPGGSAIALDLDGHNVIVHAVCDGTGTLFVLPALEEESRPPARPSTVAIFDCATPPLDGRVELIGLPIGTVNFTAYVIEKPGTTRPTVFSVSIERATD